MGKIGIIIRREFNERVKKKSFIITTILMPVFFVALMFIPMLMMNIKSDDVKEIIVIDDSGAIAQNLQDEGNMVFTPSDKTYEEEKSEGKDIFGFLLIGENVMEDGKNVKLITYKTTTIILESAISGQIRDIIENAKLKSYNIDNISQILDEIKTPVTIQTSKFDDSGEEEASSGAIAIIAAYIFGFMIYMFVFIYGAMVMQGVIEEKSSKVLELMVSSVKPFQLMMGKILGIASVAITQLVIWVVFIAVVGGGLISFFAGDMVAAVQESQIGGVDPMAVLSEAGISANTASMLGQLLDPSYLLGIIGGFLVYFIGGYLLYAAMFAAVGSAVDNEKDTQNLQMPITIPLILAIFVMINTLQNPDGDLAFWFSIIPFTSPIVMMARLPYGVPAWELWLSISLLVVTFIAIVWLAGKIYRVGIFMYGKKPTFKELGKWIRYKS